MSIRSKKKTDAVSGECAGDQYPWPATHAERAVRTGGAYNHGSLMADVADSMALLAANMHWIGRAITQREDPEFDDFVRQCARTSVFALAARILIEDNKNPRCLPTACMLQVLAEEAQQKPKRPKQKDELPPPCWFQDSQAGDDVPKAGIPKPRREKNGATLPPTRVRG